MFIIHVYIDRLLNRNTTQIARLRRTPSTLGQAVTICSISAAQKIQKLSETPVITVLNIAKLCVIDGKNRKITNKSAQPVPRGVPKMAILQCENSQKVSNLKMSLKPI